MQDYFVEETFDKLKFTIKPLAKGEYELCTFKNCDFSNADLSEIKFVDCDFNECNLSLARLTLTAFRDARFLNCKMLGLQFDTCNEFGFAVYFENCNLNNSNFYKTKLKATVFKNVVLQEVDFTESDLAAAVFEDCDLLGATFENTNLEKADFRTSFNFAIDPELNRIKKAKFSQNGLAGLLGRYDIDIEQ